MAEADRQRIGGDLHRIQTEWPVGMPLCRALGGGLWEMRSRLSGNRIARLLFIIHGGRIGVVHGFIKKTPKTPAADMDLARMRMKEMLQ
jgi:phage-related protein